MQLASSKKNLEGTFIAALGYFCALPFVLSLIYINVDKSSTWNNWAFSHGCGFLLHIGAALSVFVIFIGPWIILGTFIAALITLRLKPSLANRIALWIMCLFEAWVWVCVAGWRGW